MTETLIGESAGQDSTNDTLNRIPNSDNNAGNGTETLPIPLPQIGPQARNYVAYIPVPISDDEAEDEDYEEYDDDDEYRDDDEEYYYDDEDEYYDDEDDYDYEIKKPKRPTKKQKNR